MPDNQPEMASAQQPPQPQSAPPPAPTTPAPAPKASYVAQLLLGVLAFFLLLIGIGGFVLFLAIGPRNLVDAAVSVVALLIPIGLGVWIPIRRWRRGPGVLVGFLIGLGVSALAFGICAFALG